MSGLKMYEAVSLFVYTYQRADMALTTTIAALTDQDYNLLRGVSINGRTEMMVSALHELGADPEVRSKFLDLISWLVELRQERDAVTKMAKTMNDEHDIPLQLYSERCRKFTDAMDCFREVVEGIKRS